MQSITFGRQSKTIKEFPLGTGQPPKVTAEFNGYTGTKKRNFPTKFKGERLPDVTLKFSNFRDAIFEELDTKKTIVGKIKLLRDNFHTGEAWDTKFLQDFPGRDVFGNTQYATYKGKVVSANYLSNNIFGQVMHKVGFSEKTSKAIAKLYSCGLVRIFSKGKLPHSDLLKFRDPIEDQEAITSGFLDRLKQNPWINQNIDPSRPHPKIETSQIVKKLSKTLG